MPAYSTNELADIASISNFIQTLDAASPTPTLFSVILLFQTKCSDGVRRSTIGEYVDFIYPTFGAQLTALNSSLTGVCFAEVDQPARNILAISLLPC